MRYFKLILPDGSISICASVIEGDADIGNYIEITKEEYEELFAQINHWEEIIPPEPLPDDAIDAGEFLGMVEEIL